MEKASGKGDGIEMPASPSMVKPEMGALASPGSKRLGDDDDIPASETKAAEDTDQKKDELVEQCNYLQLFSTADGLDILLMSLGLIGAIGGGIMMPLFAVVFGDFIDAFGAPDTDFMNTVSNIALKFLYLAIGAFVAMYLEVAFFTWSGVRQTNRLRQRYLAAVLRQDVGFFDTAATTGGLLQGINEDAISIQNAISEKFSNVVHHFCTFIAGFIVGFTYSWDLTLVMVGCLPFLAIMGGIIAKFAATHESFSQKLYTEAGTVAQQAISNIRTVSAYNGQERVLTLYTRALDATLKSGFRTGAIVGSSIGGIQFIMYCSYAVGLFYGAHRVASGHMEGGTVLAVLIATLMASFALGQASPNFQFFSRGRVAGARLFGVLQRVPGMRDVDGFAVADVQQQHAGDDKAHHGSSKPAGWKEGYSRMLQVLMQNDKAAAAKAATGSAKPGSQGTDKATALLALPAAPAMEAHGGTGELAGEVRGELELQDITFAYPIRPEIPVFSGFSLRVPAGHTVALVGSSGSGKSTAVQLIERFYDPQAGRVLLDGVDLRALKLSWLRQHMGLVSQEPTLFATTVYENIAMGKEGATEAEVHAAAAAANAHKFIAALPEGYATLVGERGTQMSGGQKQRIAIARAILKNPRILLLDEATSALDTSSERLVQAALDRMVVGRTTVVVAHRLSTIKHADAIAVVAGGRVAELGTHDKLLRDPLGVYTNLVQLQMQRHAEPEAEEPVEGVVEAEEEDPELAAAALAGLASNALGSNGGLEPALSEQLGISVARHRDLEQGISQPDFHASSMKPGAAGNALSPHAAASATGSNGAAGVRVPGHVMPLGQASVDSAQPSATGAAASMISAQSIPAPSTGLALASSLTSAPTSGPLSEVPRRGSVDAHQRRVSAGDGGLARHSAEAAGKPDAAATPAQAGPRKKLSEAEEKKLAEEAAKQIPMSRLLKLNKPEWPAALFGLVASALAGMQNPAFAFVLADMTLIFYDPDPDHMKSRASFYSWMFFVIACGALITLAIQQTCFSYMAQHLSRRVRVMLLGSILRQDVAFFDAEEHSSGRLASALATDATYIRGAVGDSVGVALQNLATLAAGYLIAFIYDWRMALLITGCMPILITGAIAQMNWAMGNANKSDKLYQAANQLMSEAFSSIRVVHAYNLQPYIFHTYSTVLDSASKTLIRGAHTGGLVMAYSFFSIFAMYSLIIYFGGWEISRGLTDFEGMYKSFLAVLFAAMGMAQVGATFPDIGKAKAAVGRVFPLIDRVPAIDASSPEGEAPPPETVRGEIEFRGVRFAYPSRPTVVIYRDFSLHIEAGKTCALVGESGSGKSTVVALLERFYDPQAGDILLDGRPLASYNLKWMRQQVGLVSQEPLLFAGTIADNIAYGAPGASLEEVEAAARAANASDFIAKLPEGVHTRVGEGGIQLSGGQKQRIAIARAVIKNPKVLLLDEATSALDARSERAVQAALDVVAAGRTTLTIAHRLSTIRNAHSISVVFRGVILEQGNHDQLMALPGGAYARLVAAQEATAEGHAASVAARTSFTGSHK
uniref:ATP-binding cassette transporter n=1 Tax=Chlamydomonas leiostraca TaxID=1034604 RepID=A0A7S0R4U3_9CHLO|mmetsp:Transcript_13766/g.33853  ORF Transcript_13766/g.33853 Transcript_13766/m.33853 type:complete len:1545 (+) Transcript_13766:111-4745(+)